MSNADTIRTYFSERHLPKPRTIRPLRGGVVNPAFLVDESQVFRFNVRDPHQKKFLREKIAFEHLAGQGLPVPRVLDYCTYLTGELLVTERLPGRRISDDWARASNETRDRLGEQAADLLRKIHLVSWNNFGPLEDMRFDRWSAFLEAALAKNLFEASKRNLLSASILRAVPRAFEIARTSLSEITKPKLVHGDFHFGNVLAEGDRITALIDFEWALAGDPLMDFRHRTNLRDSASGAEIRVETHYRQRAGLPAALAELERTRLDFYTLLAKLELLSVSIDHWVGKVSWGGRNHKQLLMSFNDALERLLHRHGGI